MFDGKTLWVFGDPALTRVHPRRDRLVELAKGGSKERKGIGPKHVGSTRICSFA